MCWVYMLECADGSFYTGWTTDLEKRLESHNQGAASKYTRSRRPVRMIKTFKVEDKSAALKLEAQIKRLSRKAKEKLIAKSDQR